MAEKKKKVIDKTKNQASKKNLRVIDLTKRPPMKAPMKGVGKLGDAMRAKEKRKKRLESI